MGFLSKLWKGIKKTFKKIFKPIKKVFKSVGKFMNKIGIVGQIAMMFLPIPGLSSIFGALGNVGSKALGWLNKFGAVGQGAAKILGSAYKFVRGVARPFVDLTKGVTSFITDTSKFILNKIPGVNITSAPTSIFGKGGAWETASGMLTDTFSGFTGDVSEAFSMNIDDLLPETAASSTLASVDAATAVTPSTPTSSVDAVEKTSSFTERMGEAVTESISNIGKQWTDIVTDPVGATVQGATDYASSLLSPTSVATMLSSDQEEDDSYLWYSKVNQPFVSSPYGAAQQGLQEDPEMFQMRSSGFLQGGFDVRSQPGMGFGGFDFNDRFQQRFKKFAPPVGY